MKHNLINKVMFVVIIVSMSGFVLFSSKIANKERIIKEKEQLFLREIFDKTKEEAKKITGNFCNNFFFTFVEPPEGLNNGKTAHFFMGHEINDLDDFRSYTLVIEGDQIQLKDYKGNILGQKLGKRSNIENNNNCLLVW